MIIPLSAYDPNHKIGYIWMDYNLFGDGIFDKSIAHYKSQEKAEQVFLNQVELGIELFFENEEGFLLDIFGEEPKEELEEQAMEEIADESLEEFEVLPPPKDLDYVLDFSNLKFESEKEFWEYVKVQSPKSRTVFIDRPVNVTRNKWIFLEEAYSDPKMLYQIGQEMKDGISEFQIYQDRKEYLDVFLVEFKKGIFLNKLNLKAHKSFIDDWVFSAAEMIDDPVRFFGFVERIKNLGIHYVSSPLTIAMEKEILKINLTTDKKKWWKHSDAIISLLQTNKLPTINSKPDYDILLAEIMTSYPYQKWPDHYYKINDLGNKHTISKEELAALPGLAVTHGISIAPLSILDDRTIYDMQEEEYQNKLTLFRNKINNTKNKSQRKSYQEDLMDLSQYRSEHYEKIKANAKAKSIHKIIEDMESFLDWAKDISANWKMNEST